MKFDKVVIKNNTTGANNIHLAVHPFRCAYVIKHMMEKGDYDVGYGETREPLPDWQQKLSDELWDNIPGLQSLFFQNGEITLQHSGVFDDTEIIKSSTDILNPYLERELRLQKLAGK